MREFEFKNTVPIKEMLKDTQFLFRIGWEADKATLSLYYVTAVLGGLITLGTSWILKILIDKLQVAQAEALTTIPLIITFTLVARYLVTFIQDLFYHTYHFSYLDYVLRYHLQNAITQRLARKITSLDIAHFESPKTQNLITQVRDTVKWQLPDLFRLLATVTRDLIAYVAAFIVLIPFGWWIPFVITIVTIPRLYLRSKYGALQWSYWASGAPENRKLWYYDGLFTDPVAVREMKIGQSAPILLAKFTEIQGYLLGLHKTALDKYIRVSVIPPFLEMALIILIAYTFLDDVLTEALSIGTFTLLINMLSQVNSTAASASSNFGGLYEKGLYLYNFAELMRLPDLVPKPTHPVAIDAKVSPHIEFRNVSFAYPDGPKVLHNISFTIAPGESIALVGHNGAGKSTIISLLCRFYDVSEGEILINGINIKQLDLSSWYATLGTLFQDYVKYYFTVKENIAFGEAESANVEAVASAAQKSGAYDYIQKMPSGFDQQLGRFFENGEELSGGQWQKLAIARAFYKKPPVLILDEPTSAIDAEAEFEIFNNLEAQYQDKSLILVSHRFSTVRNADKIYVIDEGRIIEQGSHNDLLALSGKYANMFSIQAQGYQ